MQSLKTLIALERRAEKALTSSGQMFERYDVIFMLRGSENLLKNFNYIAYHMFLKVYFLHLDQDFLPAYLGCN